MVEIYRNLRRNIREDGLIVSSSGFLVRAMLRKIDFSRAIKILEIGSGKGAFTGEILKRMAPGSELHVCEIKTDYNPCIEALIAQYPEHDVTLFNACITEVMDANCDYDVIISSLPLKNFARMNDNNGFLNRVIECFHKGLKDGGTYLQYQYFRSNKRDIEKIFGKAMDEVDFVALNILPAFIYHMKKSANATTQREA